MYVILNSTIFDSFKYGKMFHCRINTEDTIGLLASFSLDIKTCSHSYVFSFTSSEFIYLLAP